MQYTNFKCRVLHQGELSNEISTSSGVRQGCILSPLLFLVVLDEVLAFTLDRKNCRGIQWDLLSNEYLNDLDYADNIAMLSIAMTCNKS